MEKIKCFHIAEITSQYLCKLFTFLYWLYQYRKVQSVLVILVQKSTVCTGYTSTEKYSLYWLYRYRKVQSVLVISVQKCTVCTGYISTDIMLYSCFIFGGSCIQFSFQKLVIVTEVCGCYHNPSKEMAEEFTVTSCCILSKSLFSNTVLHNVVLSERLAASLNTAHT